MEQISLASSPQKNTVIKSHSSRLVKLFFCAAFILFASLSWSQVDLRISNLGLNRTAVYPGSTITVSFTESNAGSLKANNHFLVVGLSNNAMPDASDPVLWSQQTVLAGGASSSYQVEITLPSSLSSGSYYILAVTDPNNAIAESLETNNFQSVAIQVTTSYPDLCFLPGTYVTPAHIAKGKQWEGKSYTSALNGTLQFQPIIEVWLSADQSISPDDILIESFTRDASGMNELSTYAIPHSLEIGQYYVIFRVDPENEIPEDSESNNIFIEPLEIQEEVDLAVTSLILSKTDYHAGDLVNFSYSVSNQSPNTSKAGWIDLIIVEEGSTLRPSFARFSLPSIPGNGSHTVSQSINLPADMASGTYLFQLYVDLDNIVVETNDYNNSRNIWIDVLPEHVHIGSVEFNSQAEIDDFHSTPYTYIDGNLIISETPSTPIINLNGLSKLTGVNGTLGISGNKLLHNLGGLQNIQSIKDIDIEGNSGLTSLAALSSSLSFSKPDIARVTVRNNSQLQNFCGISNLVHAIPGTRVTISENAWNPSYVNFTTGKCNNVRPVAELGMSKSLFEQATTHLDGTLSYDEDADALSYSWEVDADLNISDPHISQPSITCPDISTNQIRHVVLTVFDGYQYSNPDTLVLSLVANQAPIADAGQDQTIREGQTCQLDGSGSSDPEKGVLEYQWTAPNGVILSNANSNAPNFSAPNVDTDTALNFFLQVDDGLDLSAIDTVTILVRNNRPPVAITSHDIVIREGTSGSFHGNNSYDPEMDALDYAWDCPQDFNISDPTQPSLEFIAPIVEKDSIFLICLLVSDGMLNSEMDTLRIQVLNNVIPIARAGEDFEANEGSQVELTGLESSDADEDVLEYFWEAPEGISLSSNSSATPSFTAPSVDANRQLSFILQVKDYLETSFADTVVVTVLNENSNGLEDPEESAELQIGPNPTNGEIRIKSSEEIIDLKLFKLNGSLVWTLQGEKNATLYLNFSDLAPGSYILVGKTVSKAFQEKIIIKP